MSRIWRTVECAGIMKETINVRNMDAIGTDQTEESSNCQKDFYESYQEFKIVVGPEH